MKILLLLLFPLGLFAQVSTLSETSPKLKYANTIVVEDLQKHISVLAGDSLQGRETGQPGQKMASNYIAKFFKEIGIPPYKNNSYLRLNLNVNNVLNNTTFKTGGFEQLRYDASNIDRFPNKYGYMYGRTFFVMLSYLF